MNVLDELHRAIEDYCQKTAMAPSTVQMNCFTFDRLCKHLQSYPSTVMLHTPPTVLGMQISITKELKDFEFRFNQK